MLPEINDYYLCVIRYYIFIRKIVLYINLNLLPPLEKKVLLTDRPTIEYGQQSHSIMFDIVRYETLKTSFICRGNNFFLYNGDDDAEAT